MVLTYFELLLLNVTGSCVHPHLRLIFKHAFFFQLLQRFLYLRLHYVFMEVLVESVLVLVHFLDVAALVVVAPADVSG